MKNTGSALRCNSGQAKIIIILIVLAVLGGLGYVVWQRNEGVPVGQPNILSFREFNSSEYKDSFFSDIANALIRRLTK